jgi:quinolinate synthase
MNLNVAYPTPAYAKLELAEVRRRIKAAKAILGNRLLILGHHYQVDEVIEHADIVGDSLQLSRAAAATNAELIVFCGVHFMAETADLLTAPHQQVFLPNIDAGCSLADMADIAKVTLAWRTLIDEWGEQIVPITYINSAIELKAFCGEHGGAVCTSSNAAAVLNWAWQRQPRVFFFPDQHLGRNTAYRQGLSLEQMVLYSQEQIASKIGPDVKLILWNGHCCVHQEFRITFYQQLKQQRPEVKIIVHPECNFELARLADFMGSTEYIIKTIKAAATGTSWAVATEVNLVKRLQQQRPDLEIILPSDYDPRCRTMAMITPVHLLFQLENLVQGHYINRVVVPEKLRQPALLAVNRMLELTR